MAEIGIFVGSVYGNALLIAKEAQKKLIKNKHTVTIYDFPNLSDWNKYINKYILIVTSTTGHGDLPDNITPLYQSIKANIVHKTKLKYGIVILGDSSYQRFCNGGKQFDKLLQNKSALRIGKMLLIDASKEITLLDQFSSWLREWIALIN